MPHSQAEGINAEQLDFKEPQMNYIQWTSTGSFEVQRFSCEGVGCGIAFPASPLAFLTKDRL